MSLPRKSQTLRPLATLLLAAMAAFTLSTTLATTPSLPEGPQGATGLVYAQPFTVDVPFPYDWSADKPLVSRGFLIVIEADPALLRPRETAEPVLYVGDRPAWRISRAHSSGRIVLVCPGEFPLDSAEIWFGSPELPERVTPALAQAERTRARLADLRPFAKSRIDTVLDEPATFANRAELLNAAAELAERLVTPFAE